MISLQDENTDKTIEEELRGEGGNQQILMKPLSHLPLAGSAGHDVEMKEGGQSVRRHAADGGSY